MILQDDVCEGLRRLLELFHKKYFVLLPPAVHSK